MTYKVKKTKSNVISTAYAMEHQRDYKELVQEALAPNQDRLANIPTRDDLKECLHKVEDDLMKRLNEKFACQEAKIKRLEGCGDSLHINDVTVSELEQRITTIEDKIGPIWDLERRIDEGEQHIR